MPDTIRTKQELLALFADNTSKDITPQRLRDFVVSNNVHEVQTESAPAVLDTLTDFFIAKPGCNALALSTVDAYGERTLAVVNDSSGNITITPDGAETIEGAADLVLPDQALIFVAAEPGATDWNVIINTAAATPPARRYQVQASNNNPNSGQYLEFVHSQGSDDAGYLVIKDAIIIAASISRTDADTSIIEIVAPSATVEIITTTLALVIDPLNIAVSSGDLIRARVKVGENSMDNVCLTLLLEET